MKFKFMDMAIFNIEREKREKTRELVRQEREKKYKEQERIF